MESLRIWEQPEPTHIHIPRPSRLRALQGDRPTSVGEDLCGPVSAQVDDIVTPCTWQPE
jgi:hypothetical protein